MTAPARYTAAAEMWHLVALCRPAVCAGCGEPIPARRRAWVRGLLALCGPCHGARRWRARP